VQPDDDCFHFRTCSLCEATCGLAITVRNGRVAAMRPDADDVWSRGSVCLEGTVLGHVHHDPTACARRSPATAHNGARCSSALPVDLAIL